MAFQMFVLFLGGGFLYLNVIRTMAVIPNCVTVIKKPIRAVSLGGPLGKPPRHERELSHQPQNGS